MLANALSAREWELICIIRQSERRATESGLARKLLSPLLPGIKLTNCPEEENQIIDNAIDTLWAEHGNGGIEPPAVRELVRMVLRMQIEEYRKGLSLNEAKKGRVAV